MAGLAQSDCGNVAEQTVTGYLEEFIADGLAVEEKNRYLGLALPNDIAEPSPGERW